MFDTEGGIGDMWLKMWLSVATNRRLRGPSKCFDQ
ncbi:predicted protein [Botrytis cinerea T4]|uniref:Uncharacterized protein n=1 Tax=Botryotinia fuckeliana (strain T4) TaxID=999810 RepID=G2Y7E4_BOTF4|nr:predicted protein [Botrytis cinerea T4]